MPNPEAMASRDEVLKRLKLDPDKIRAAFESGDDPIDVPRAQSKSLDALRGLGSFELDGVDVTEGKGGYDITLRVLVDPDELGPAKFEVRWVRVNDRKFGALTVVREHSYRRDGRHQREIVLKADGEADAALELRRAPMVVVEGRLADGRKFWGVKKQK